LIAAGSVGLRPNNDSRVSALTVQHTGIIVLSLFARSCAVRSIKGTVTRQSRPTMRCTKTITAQANVIYKLGIRSHNLSSREVNPWGERIGRSRTTMKKRRMFGIHCARCDHEIIAPHRTEFLDDRVIRHLWQCPRCKARFFQKFPRMRG
jgi:hypothetical protein